MVLVIGVILFVEEEVKLQKKRMDALNGPRARLLTGDVQVINDLVEEDVERPVMQN